MTGINTDPAFRIPTRPARIPVLALAVSLGSLLAITFAFCVAFDLIFPERAMYQSWARLLPWFSWLSWPSFALGLVESFLYGVYIAVIFAPLYNTFNSRSAH